MQSTIDFTKLNNVAEIELKYSHKVKPSDRPQISSSSDAYEILNKVWNPDTRELQEEFKIILMNRANKVLGIKTISMGGISGTVADPKLIFATVLKAGASSVILAHNHPSGNLKPSEADMRLTKKMKQAGEVLETPVLDHIVLGHNAEILKYFSFADEGLM